MSIYSNVKMKCFINVFTSVCLRQILPLKSAPLHVFIPCNDITSLKNTHFYRPYKNTRIPLTVTPTLLPSPWKSLICFLFLWFCLFQALQINRIIQRLFVSGFFHFILSCFQGSYMWWHEFTLHSFLQLINISLLDIPHFFICSLVYGYLSSLHF